MLKKLKLGTQFTLLLTIVFLLGLLISGTTLWNIVQQQAEDNVATKAEMLTRTINSVRIYTSEHITPLLAHQLNTAPQFIRETVPAFSAKTVFDGFNNSAEYQSFSYKEATLNPTNIEDKADSFETVLIDRFRKQSDLDVFSGYRSIGRKNLFYVARPLAVKQSSCLQCHSIPDVAPRSQRITYGDLNGFGWQLNETIGAQVIYVPSDEVFATGRNNLVKVMTIFSGVLGVAVLLLNRLLKWRVVEPLKQLNIIAQQVSSGMMTADRLSAFDDPIIDRVARRSDEPGQLARTFQAMAHEVAYREQNLTAAVAQRTLELEQKTVEAQTANQAKSRFLANMSHELRTPLNVILGFTQLMMRSKTLDPQIQGYVETIGHSGEHLLASIDNVLEISKIEAGKITLNPTFFDLYNLLDSIEAMLKLKAESQGLKLVFRRSQNVARTLNTDRAKLRQVLINLLGNSLKFTQIGQITLRISQRQGHVDFEVEDTGAGIAPEELPKLFQSFEQTASGKNSQAGTGLGLAICEQFIQLMGGTISVRSQVGVGTVFRFDLPSTEPTSDRFLASPLPPIATQAILGLAPGEPHYRILVVDDKPQNRQLVVELLTPIGFEVRAASTGEEAIALAATWAPHLIWMDIQMPILDGYAATKAIKSRHPAPIVIALSGSVFEDDRQQALAMGCDDFVSKPFRTEVLLEKMAIYLGVRYRYEADASSQLNLSVMSPNWIDRLQQAAMKVNAKEILQLIAEIPAAESNLAKSIEQLVDRFCFEEIVAICQSRRSTAD